MNEPQAARPLCGRHGGPPAPIKPWTPPPEPPSPDGNGDKYLQS